MGETVIPKTADGGSAASEILFFVALLVLSAWIAYMVVIPHQASEPVYQKIVVKNVHYSSGFAFYYPCLVMDNSGKVYGVASTSDCMLLEHWQDATVLVHIAEQGHIDDVRQVH